MTQPILNPMDSLSPDEYTYFLHKLRHDLRNTLSPLTEIPMWIEEDFAEVNTPLPAGTQDNLRMLKIHSARISYIIEDLLTLANIGQDQGTPSVSLRDVISDHCSLAIPDNFQLTQHHEHDELPIPRSEAQTLVDALLSNSVKHHDRDHGLIEIRSKKLEATVQLSVTDNGPGIRKEHHESVFRPLTTLASRDQCEGSGLGLTLVKRIAEIHGGSVKIISPDNTRGCCVIVRFPQTTIQYS